LISIRLHFVTRPLTNMTILTKSYKMQKRP